MSDLIAILNDWSASWLAWLLERSVVFAVAFLAIVPLALLLGRRRLMGAHAVSFALLLPLALLLVPAERWLPDAWPTLLPASVAEIDLTDPVETSAQPLPEAPAISSATGGVAEVPNTISPDAVVGIQDRFAPAEGAPQVGPSWSWSARLFLGWVGLCVGFGLRLVLRQRRAERFLSDTSSAPAESLDSAFGSCRDRTGIRRSVRLRVSDELDSPATVGVLRPVVFLPRNGFEVLSKRELEFVLLHELAHVRRLDVLTEGFLRFLRAAFFFHPAVWLTVPLERRWREMACDEAALARTGATGRTPGAQALLSLADPARAAARERLATVHLLTDGEIMKTRIERLLDTRRNPEAGIGTRGVVTAALLGGFALTAANAQQVVREKAEREVPERVVVELDDVTPQGSIELDLAIREGTRWLLERQEEDGRFGLGVAPQGKPRDHNDAFATGLAIQALLPEKKGPDGKKAESAIAKAVGFLISTQNEKGRYGDDDPMTFAYGHAQALRALALVQQSSPSPRLRESLEAAVVYAETHRNPYAGWRYEPRSGDNDSKITGLMLLGLIEARRAGIAVPSETIQGGLSTLQSLLDESTGRTGFVTAGQPMSRFVWKIDDYPRKYSEEPTALHLVVAFECGKGPIEERWMRKALDLLVDTPPDWSKDKGSIDYSYWQYGAEAMRHVDGYHRRLWQEKLVSELASRRQSTDNGAYWPAVDAWSSIGMESWTTAAALVALQSMR